MFKENYFLVPNCKPKYTAANVNVHLFWELSV